MFKPVQFGKYYLTDRIAVGGMAEIFKASLRGVSGFAKQMVVKQILPQYANDPEFVRMFINEAKTTVSLEHGNIVAIYELGRINHIYFIAMEYVPGKNLGEILEAARDNGMPLSVHHAVFIAIELCKGLDYAHRRTDENGALIGLIHRDISPGNVLVSFSGQVKIADFGIAKVLKRRSTTRAGVVKGTYGYMSPQQIAGEQVDHRTDIFGSGVLLHEMLTGRRLFAGANEFDTLQRAREATVAPPSAINPAVPPEVDAIVLKALAREPELRYYNASEFQLDLARFLYSGEGDATASSLASYLEELFASERQRPAASAAPSGGDPNETETEDLMPDRVSSPQDEEEEHSQSYAVRVDLDGDPALRRAVALAQTAVPTAAGSTAAADSQPDATRAYGTFESLSGPDLTPEDFDEGGTPTALFPHEDGPKRPEVPRLLFGGPNAAQERPKTTDTHLEALAGPLPTGEGSASGPDDTLPGPGAMSPPGPASQPGNPQGLGHLGGGSLPHDPAQVPKRRGPRSDESVMALLVRSPTDEQRAAEAPDVSLLQAATPAPPPSAGEVPAALTSPPSDQAGPGSTAEIRPPHGATGAHDDRNTFTATIQLFVQGLDKVEPLSQTSSIDKIPRHIRPTVLGWIVIVALFCCSIGFVLYRKTNLFRDAPANTDALLELKDLKLETDERDGPKLGTIRLVALPRDALVMLHVGETPLEIAALDRGMSHLLRLERQGYRSKNQLVSPQQLSGSGDLAVAMEPVGAGVAPDYPTEVPAGKRTDQTAKLSVTSDPPSATVWRVLGRGEVQLPDVPVRRYYFKVVSPGHQTSFVSVSVEQFRAGQGRVRESITLRPTTDAAGSAKAADAGPPTADAAVAAAEQATARQDAAAAAKKPAVSKAKRRATVKKATRRSRKRISRSKRRSTRKTRRSTRRRTKKRQPKKLQVPTWAD